MNRRSFVTLIVGATAASMSKGSSQLALAEQRVSGRELALPTAEQLAWQDLEIGMFVHIAPNTWQDREQDDMSAPLSEVNPDSLDTDQWAQAAVALGAKHIVFVAKHSGGFCMWQTHTTDYGIRNTPWRNGKGDVLADISASCRKYGLKLGLYVSPHDLSQGAENAGICKTPADQKKYNAIYRQQLTEVLSRYGSMVELWFDGSVSVPVDDILRLYAPRTVIFQGPEATIRWVGNEDGFAPYPLWNAEPIAEARSGGSTSLQSDPDGDAWMPVECDVSIRRPDWFWSRTNATKLMTLDQLIEVYYRSVGRGAQLLLNIPPNRQGLIAEEDFARAKEFGAEIQRRFGASVAETQGTGNTVALVFPKPARVDHVILQEDCRLGQRVRSFHLEGKCEGAWVALYSGSSIGHKRIIAMEPRVCSALRLTVSETRGEPHIRRLAAFDTGSIPPPTWDATRHEQEWVPDKAGTWSGFHFDVDLTSKITAAAQYRVRFIAERGAVTAIRDVKLLENGVSEPGYIRTDLNAKEALILTIPGIGQRIVVSGRVEGGQGGSIYIEKI